MLESKFFEEKGVKVKSSFHEKKVAKTVKGKTTIGSGCLPFSKADVFTGNVRIECKRTDKISMKVEKDWFVKLKEQCLVGEIPVLNIEIQDESWFLVRKEEFGFILEGIKEDNDGILGSRKTEKIL